MYCVFCGSNKIIERNYLYGKVEDNNVFGEIYKIGSKLECGNCYNEFTVNYDSKRLINIHE